MRQADRQGLYTEGLRGGPQLSLEDWRRRIAVFLQGRRLTLHPEKTSIRPTWEPAAFLGYVLLPGHRRLPEDNVHRFRNRLRGLRDRYRAGTVTLEEARQRIEAWIAHAENADTWRLRHAIFQGRLFDPALATVFRDGQTGPKRKPDRPPVVGFSAAVPGTTNRGTHARRTATGTTPTTATTTSVSALPARPMARTGGFMDPPGVHACVQGRS